VEVFPTDDDGPSHLGGDHTSGKDSSSDRDLAGKGALLVNVSAVDGFSGSLCHVETCESSRQYQL
jgi:hypothetical protein